MGQETLLDKISDELLIKLAILEDVGSDDVTTSSILVSIPDRVVKAKIVAKENLIIAGLELFEMVFKYIDSSIKIISSKIDGDFCKKGTTILNIEGNFSSILKGERVALNILQHLSGIATNTFNIISHIGHTKIKILDTRKTIPLWRKWQKYAVRVGGGYNHRFGLYDMFLIKENHISVAGSITKAVELAKSYNHDLLIEVEVKNMKEVKEAVKTKADIIMLDNMDYKEIKKAVKYIRENSDKKIEVSGNMDIKKIKKIKKIDIDYVSMGSLTHSVKASDISLIIDL